jgi:hypothetical protein
MRGVQMGQGRSAKALIGAAVVIACWVVVPVAAQAQCVDEDNPDSEFTECGEASNVSTQLGGSLTSIGDTVVNQQLNFGGIGGIGAFAGPTGRLRHTEHDGLKIKGQGQTTGEFKADEGSVFANASYDLPGTYFGGKIRVSGLLGYNELIQDDEAKTFRNEIDAFIYGGSYLWSQGNFYSMSLIIGLSGEADGENIGGTYNYDVSGYFTNSLIGYTWDMSGGWKFDARVNLGHYDMSQV